MQKVYALVTVLLATLAARVAALISTAAHCPPCPLLLRCLLRFNRQRSIQRSNLPRKPVDDSKPHLVCAWR